MGEKGTGGGGGFASSVGLRTEEGHFVVAAEAFGYGLRLDAFTFGLFFALPIIAGVSGALGILEYLTYSRDWTFEAPQLRCQAAKLYEYEMYPGITPLYLVRYNPCSHFQVSSYLRASHT